ncbi:MAG TPA: OmpH family outer membrane protein [Prosthecobacter sp.]|nr:OmpH family outer membrane protein [Prosthecobacter sp.]
MNRILAIVTLLATAAASTHAADLKFGVVDMSKAFSEYYKTKQKAEEFKSNVEKAQKEMNDGWTVYKNLNTDLQKLRRDISDPIASGQARAKKSAEFEEKAKELRQLEMEIGEKQNRRSAQLKREDMEIRGKIYEEILVVVKAKAKADGYDFVFDKSGMSLSTVPVLIYYKDAVDVTDQIIVELNKDAPAPTVLPAQPADDAGAAKKK